MNTKEKKSVVKLIEFLNDKVNQAYNMSNQIEEKKNDLLEIKNVLYKYGIIRFDVDMLFELSKNDLKVIVDNLETNDKKQLLDVMVSNIELLKNYRQLRDRYHIDINNESYENSYNWLKEIVKKINNYCADININVDNYLNKVKIDSSLYKKYLDKFRSNELIDPIRNLEEFCSLIEEFEEEDKINILVYVSKMNCILIMPNEYKIDVDIFSKYRAIVEAKKDKYNSLYETCKNNYKIELSCFIPVIKVMEEDLSIDQATAKSIATSILLEKELNKYDNEHIDSNIINKNIEDIMDISKKEIEEKEEESNEIVLEEVEDILVVEKELINEYNSQNFGQNLANSINSDSKEAIKYKMISVLNALYVEYERYKNAGDIKGLKDIALGNIRQYILAYKTLKKNMNCQED